MKHFIMGIVERIEYDPNRSSQIALVRGKEREGVYQRKCNMIEKFALVLKILESITTTICGPFFILPCPGRWIKER